MTMTSKQLDSLVGLLAQTQEVEADCGDCLQALAEFADTRLAGKSIPDRLRSIDEHLGICGECREEFEALRDAIAGELI